MICSVRLIHLFNDNILDLSKFNSLPNDKILDWSKFKGLANDKINVAQNLNFIYERVENILGTGENAVTSIFSFSQNGFKRPTPQGSLKVGIVW